jgi:carbon storage regulator CsrA
MLVMSRKLLERIRVRTPAGDIWIQLVGVKCGKARLGIDAPREFLISREELLPPEGPAAAKETLNGESPCPQ